MFCKLEYEMATSDRQKFDWVRVVYLVLISQCDCVTTLRLDPRRFGPVVTRSRTDRDSNQPGRWGREEQEAVCTKKCKQKPFFGNL